MRKIFKQLTAQDAIDLTGTLVAASLPATGVALTGIGSREYAAHRSEHNVGGLPITVEYSVAPTAEQIAASEAVLVEYWSE